MGIGCRQHYCLVNYSLTMKSLLRFSVVAITTLLVACSTQSLLSWESSDRKRPHYEVKQGDTLYSIAWGYGLDFRRLAVVNDLHPPYPLSPGQILRLPNGFQLGDQPRSRKPTLVATAPKPSTRPASKPATKPSATAKPAPSPKPKPASTASKPKPTAVTTKVPNLGRWAWPNDGKLVKNWGSRKHRKSGLDISASPGQAVTASAPGVVVYSGGGLARYGQLVILKHSEELLSAYAYNQSLLVKKGQRVAQGEKIALSGRSPDGIGVVHFEIRRRGQPVDALQYLKPRRG